MSVDFDIIVVGSGPAGVSSAIPLVEAGLNVLLVDGGRELTGPVPSKPYLESRVEDEHQWEWLLGRDYFALANRDAVSPKLKVPVYSQIFEDFATANKIDSQGFLAIGSLARGGLSNAWGCGVACLSTEELAKFPFPCSEIQASYARVSQRIGISGAVTDDLSDYFGLDEWADPPLKMDSLQSRLMSRYQKNKSAVSALGMRLGRSRVAVLGQDRGTREACNYCGNCLWGCYRQSLYSAVDDLKLLKTFDNFTHRPGLIVEKIIGTAECRAVEGRAVGDHQRITAKKIILAAGTLATTRLALQSIELDGSVAMQSNPTAAFMLWLPAGLGMQHESSFALGQLSFVMSLRTDLSVFGSLFTTTGIPIAEFSRHLPFSRRYGIDILREILSSCIVGNIFLPGNLTASSLTLTAAGRLEVRGYFHEEVDELMRRAERSLRKIFWKLGGILIPKSFLLGRPGSDIHYASTLPMRKHPKLGETDRNGKLNGVEDVYIVDGASLPGLSEKSHTLTIMANADRISTKLAAELRQTAS